jgi:hypothetical protein
VPILPMFAAEVIGDPHSAVVEQVAQAEVALVAVGPQAHREGPAGKLCQREHFFGLFRSGFRPAQSGQLGSHQSVGRAVLSTPRCVKLTGVCVRWASWIAS